jgi:hypothetical protein
MSLALTGTYTHCLVRRLMNTSIVRAERVTFQIVPGQKNRLEFYRLPSGEKRIGLSNLATVCGLDDTYFYNLTKRAPKRMEALRGMGFTGCRVAVTVGRDDPAVRGASRAETISLDDFVCFVKFAAFELRRPEATALALGLMGVAVETIARQAFGEEALTLADIRRHLCKEYAKTIDWTKEDHYDAEEIANHQLFLAGY